MARSTTTVGAGGRIVIPSSFRKRLGIEEGTEVTLVLEANAIRIMTPEQAVERAQQLVKPYARSRRSLSRELIRERRREAKGE